MTFYKGNTTWNKGLKKETDNRVRKYSDKKKGNLNPMKRIEVRHKSSLSHLGKNHLAETRRKMSITQKARVREGLNNLHPNWIFTNKNDDEERWGVEYTIWRSNVFTRDNWTCQTCYQRGIYLEAHHIKSWAKYPKLMFDVENGITLCVECHKLTDSYKKKVKFHK